MGPAGAGGETANVESHDDKQVGKETPVAHVTLSLEEAGLVVNSTSVITAAAMGDHRLAEQVWYNAIEALNRLGQAGFVALQKKLSDAVMVFENTNIVYEKVDSNLGAGKPNDLVA